MQAPRTLARYYLYTSLKSLSLGNYTWLAFVVSKGGNPGWAEAAYHMAILLGEIPTGMIADLVNRRFSMMLGLLVGALSGFGYLFVEDTVTACLVLALSGLGTTFLSGADQALLYETAEEIGGADFARKAIARSTALAMLSFGAAPVAAGFLYDWNPVAPFVTRGFICLLALSIVATLKENRQAVGAHHRQSLWSHTREAVRIVLANPLILGILIFSWGYNTIGALAGQFGQAYLPYIGFSMTVTGLVFTTAWLGISLTSRLSERLTPQAALVGLRFAPLGQALCYLGMGLGRGRLGASLHILGESLDGLISPALSARLNEELPSAQRATVLSLQSAGFSMLMTAAFPAASYLQPVTKVYYVVGTAGILLALAWAVWWSRFSWRPAV